MLRLGVIGLTEGNGHPYSWSAIINGDYDARAMADCGYPVIPAYLSANRDTLGIDAAKVTHVWTQDRKLSEGIAAASKIENVVDNVKDLIGQVDAILYAKDDIEDRVEKVKPFLDADMPVFIDKPMVITRSDLDYFAEQNAAGKFFMSCSSMRYSSECRAVKADIDSLGEIELVNAIGKKDWVKYGVHMLEALFSLLDDPRAVSVKHISKKSGKDIVYIEFETGVLATIALFYDIVGTFQISVIGQKAWKLIEIENSYSMFRDSLIEFVRSVGQGKPRLDFAKTENIIRTLIGAKESLEQNGKTITL